MAEDHNVWTSTGVDVYLNVIMIRRKFGGKFGTFYGYWMAIALLLSGANSFFLLKSWSGSDSVFPIKGT